MDDLYFRQRNLYDPARHNPDDVTFIGCGSLGGALAHTMAKLGVENFTLIDFDNVEAHNLPNQPYWPEHVGEAKVEALSDVIMRENPRANVIMLNERWTPERRLHSGGVLVNAADDIDVRREAAEAAPVDTFIIDVRSGTDSFNVLLCDKSTAAWDYYKTTFFKAEEAAGTDCNAQSTVYASYLIASIALQQFVRWATMKSYHHRIDGCLETLQLVTI